MDETRKQHLHNMLKFMINQKPEEAAAELKNVLDAKAREIIATQRAQASEAQK